MGVADREYFRRDHPGAGQNPAGPEVNVKRVTMTVPSFLDVYTAAVDGGMSPAGAVREVTRRLVETVGMRPPADAERVAAASTNHLMVHADQIPDAYGMGFAVGVTQAVTVLLSLFQGKLVGMAGVTVSDPG